MELITEAIGSICTPEALYLAALFVLFIAHLGFISCLLLIEVSLPHMLLWSRLLFCMNFQLLKRSELQFKHNTDTKF